jgi:hypothetical protein
MAAHGRRLVADRGHDRWAADFERFVEAVVAMPRRLGSEDGPHTSTRSQSLKSERQ